MGVLGRPIGLVAVLVGVLLWPSSGAGAPDGTARVSPLAVADDLFTGVTNGDQVVLRYDANNLASGNTVPVRIDGASVTDYTYSLTYGSQSVVCTITAINCNGPSVMDTQPGNLIGYTREGIQARLDNAPATCDQFNEVFTDADGDGNWTLTQICNPFLPDYQATTRVMIIPVADQLCNGSCTVTIVDFAVLFLEGFGSAGCRTGNVCEIVVRVVLSDLDSDSDGCTDLQETGSNPVAGGLRDPYRFWDFFDTADSTNVRDLVVSIGDIGRVVSRFGASGDTSIDPLSAPLPAPAYHTTFDRSAAPPGSDPWDLGPPDGAITIGDMGGTMVQFGHSCA